MRSVSTALPTLAATGAARAALGGAYGRVAAAGSGGRGPVAPVAAVAAVAAVRRIAPPGGELELAVRTFAHGGSATILRRLVGGVTVGIDALVR